MKDKCLNCGEEVEIEKERGISSSLKKIGIVGHFGLNNIGLIGAPSTGKSAFMIEEMMQRSNNEGFAIVNYNRELDLENQRLNKKFSEYLFGNDLYLGMINMYGRKPKLIPDYLVEYKIDTFYKLKAEHELIKDKKSILSSKIRTMVEKAYEIVTKPE